MLREFDDLCKRLGVKYFVGWGACLGFYRGGDYIPWDNDIDVGVMCNGEQFAELVGGLCELGYKTEGPPHYNRHWWRDSLLLDVFRVRQDGAGARFYTNLGTINHKGRDYPVPAPIEPYFVWRYGPDWRIPKRKQSTSLVAGTYFTLAI